MTTTVTRIFAPITFLAMLSGCQAPLLPDLPRSELPLVPVGAGGVVAAGGGNLSAETGGNSEYSLARRGAGDARCSQTPRDAEPPRQRESHAPAASCTAITNGTIVNSTQPETF